MQRHGFRHFTAYTITVVVYALVIFLVYYTQSQTHISSKPLKENELKISLMHFVPEVITPVKEKVIEPKVEVQNTIKEVIEKPMAEPLVKKSMPNPIEKKPVVKKSIIKKPLIHNTIRKTVKKNVKKKPKIKKNKVTKKTKKLRKKRPISKGTGNQKSKKKSSKDKSWSALQMKINRYKAYPRIAQKRRMEGSVKIQFIVSAKGSVKILSLSGKKVFYKSARRAVKRAFPIDPKKAPVDLPSTITLTLYYKLR